MIVEKFYNAMLRREAAASARLDGETWSLPRYMRDQPVWAAQRPAHVVDLKKDHHCGAHPGEYAYDVRFDGMPQWANSWPYCESQLTPRD